MDQGIKKKRKQIIRKQIRKSRKDLLNKFGTKPKLEISQNRNRLCEFLFAVPTQNTLRHGGKNGKK